MKSILAPLALVLVLSFTSCYGQRRALRDGTAANARTAATASQPQSSTQTKPSSSQMVSYSVSWHKGPVLSSAPLSLYVIWYGAWAQAEKNHLLRFLQALPSKAFPQKRSEGKATTMSDWWSVTRQYTGLAKSSVSQSFVVRGQYSFAKAVLGTSLTRNSTQFLIRHSIKNFGGQLPLDPAGLYIVLTSKEVRQDDFCSSSCGFHGFTQAGLLSPKLSASGDVFETVWNPKKGPQVPFFWVGNAQTQCMGFCGFPFVAPPYIPPQYATLLKPPGGSNALDAMIIIMAHELAESATDPFNGGWFYGDQLMPVEIADMCLGQFGLGAYPGNPGTVTNSEDGSSYNVVGPSGEKFLLPMLWSNKAKSCATST